MDPRRGSLTHHDLNYNLNYDQLRPQSQPQSRPHRTSINPYQNSIFHHTHPLSISQHFPAKIHLLSSLPHFSLFFDLLIEKYPHFLVKNRPQILFSNHFFKIHHFPLSKSSIFSRDLTIRGIDTPTIQSTYCIYIFSYFTAHPHLQPYSEHSFLN